MRDSMSLTIYYGAARRLRAVGGRRALPVGTDARRRRVRRPGAEARRADDRAHERAGIRARRGRRLRPAAGGRAGVRGRGDEDLRQPARGAGAARRQCRRWAQRRGSGLERVAEQMAGAVPGLAAAVAAPANAFAFVGRMFVMGRGLEYATAREVALKLKETCRIAAEPFTATDLVHGPIAALDPLFPVWTIASRDDALPAVLEASARVRSAGAAIVASGNAAADIEDPAYTLAVPEPRLPVLAPLLSVAARPALRRRSRPRERARSRQARGPQQGHVRALTFWHRFAAFECLTRNWCLAPLPCQVSASWRKGSMLEAPTPTRRSGPRAVAQRPVEQPARDVADRLRVVDACRQRRRAAADGEVGIAHLRRDRARRLSAGREVLGQARRHAAKLRVEHVAVGDVSLERLLVAHGDPLRRRARGRRGSMPRARSRSSRPTLPGSSRRSSASSSAASCPIVSSPAARSRSSDRGPTPGSSRTSNGARNAASPPGRHDRAARPACAGRSPPWPRPCTARPRASTRGSSRRARPPARPRRHARAARKSGATSPMSR